MAFNKLELDSVKTALGIASYDEIAAIESDITTINSTLSTLGGTVTSIGAAVTALQALPTMFQAYVVGTQALAPATDTDFFIGWTGTTAGSSTTAVEINSDDTILDIKQTGWYSISLSTSINWNSSDYTTDNYFVSSIDVNGNGAIPQSYEWTPGAGAGRTSQFFCTTAGVLKLTAGDEVRGRIQLRDIPGTGTTPPLITGASGSDLNTFISVVLLRAA